MSEQLSDKLSQYTIVACQENLPLLLLLEMLRSHLQGAPTKLDLLNLENKLMASQAEIVAGLRAIETQLRKTSEEIKAEQVEITTLKAKIAALEKVIADGDASPELLAAFNAVKAQAQVVDDELPDIPTTPVPTV